MKKYLENGDTMIDIGANIGYETIVGASLVSPNGRVHSFEPLPNLVSQIKESLSENSLTNVTIHNKAAGDSSGELILYTHSEDAGLTSTINKNNYQSKLTVPVVTLDEELKDIKPKLIKIDVEGYELETLNGAKNIIEKSKPVIVFEFSPHLYEQEYKGKSLDLFNFFYKNGYSISPIDKPENYISKENYEKLIQQILDDETIPNFVATPISVII